MNNHSFSIASLIARDNHSDEDSGNREPDGKHDEDGETIEPGQEEVFEPPKQNEASAQPEQEEVVKQEEEEEEDQRPHQPQRPNPMHPTPFNPMAASASQQQLSPYSGVIPAQNFMQMLALFNSHSSNSQVPFLGPRSEVTHQAASISETTDNTSNEKLMAHNQLMRGSGSMMDMLSPSRRKIRESDLENNNVLPKCEAGEAETQTASSLQPPFRLSPTLRSF